MRFSKKTYVLLLPLLLALLLELLLLGLGKDPARSVRLVIAGLGSRCWLGLLLALAALALLLWQGELVLDVGLCGGGLLLGRLGWFGGSCVLALELRESLLLAPLLVLAHQAHKTSRGGGFVFGGGSGVTAFGGRCIASICWGDGLAELGLPVVLGLLVALLLGCHFVD